MFSVENVSNIPDLGQRTCKGMLSVKILKDLSLRIVNAKVLHENDVSLYLCARNRNEKCHQLGLIVIYGL